MSFSESYPNSVVHFDHRRCALLIDFGHKHLSVPAIERSMIAALSTGVEHQILAHRRVPSKPVIEIDPCSRSIEENVPFEYVRARLCLEPHRGLLLPNPNFVHIILNQIDFAWLISARSVIAHSPFVREWRRRVGVIRVFGVTPRTHHIVAVEHHLIAKNSHFAQTD